MGGGGAGGGAICSPYIGAMKYVQRKESVHVGFVQYKGLQSLYFRHMCRSHKN